MDTLSQIYPILFDMAKGFLHVSTQYLESREDDCHGAYISQDPVSLIYANPLLSVRYGGEDILEAVLPV